MNGKQSVILRFTLILVALAAIAGFSLQTPLKVNASLCKSGCAWSSHCYSHGACGANDCTYPEGQYCNMDNTWGLCGSCSRI